MGNGTRPCLHIAIDISYVSMPSKSKGRSPGASVAYILVLEEETKTYIIYGSLHTSGHFYGRRRTEDQAMEIIKQGISADVHVIFSGIRRFT